MITGKFFCQKIFVVKCVNIVYDLTMWYWFRQRDKLSLMYSNGMQN